MIDDEQLKKLFKDNNLTFPRRIRLQLKAKGEYGELVEILSVLKKINISTDMIEHHPELLFTTSENIRKNYYLLKDNNIYNYTTEELLKILSMDHELVKSRYDILSKKYGIDEINKNVLVLTTPLKRIKHVEKYEILLKPDAMFSAMVSKYSESEIYNIVLACTRYDIDITANVFKRSSDEIKEIVKICKENNIYITDSIFTKTPKELEEIIKLCKNMKIKFSNILVNCPMDKIETLFSSYTDNRINIDISLLKTTEENVKKLLSLYEKYDLKVDYKTILLDPKKVLEVIELCHKYNVKVSEKMFTRTLKDIEDIIKYCKEKDIKVRDTYFERTLKEIESIHNFCNLSQKRDDLTYKRDLKEIIDILVYCKATGTKFENTMFNHNLDGVEKIINTCEKRRIPVSNGVFKTTPRNLDRIVSILKHQPLVIPFTPLACNRTPYEVQRIKELVMEYKVNVFPEMFLRTPYEVERIIKLTRNAQDAKYYQYPLSKLEEIMEFCNNHKIRISPSMLSRTTGELEDILELCNHKKIDMIDPVYQRTPAEVEEIINYCEEKGLDISGDCFRKNPEQFKEAVDVCEKLNIPAVGEVFKRTPDEIKSISKIYERMLKKDPINNSFSTTPEEVEKIITILLDNNIEITGLVFRRKADDIQNTIDFITKKYGEEFLLPQIIIYDKDQIDRVFAYCSGRGYLDVIKESPYILKLTIAEIVERDSYVNVTGGSFVEDGRFNPVFAWSKKKFQEMKEAQIKAGKKI